MGRGGGGGVGNWFLPTYIGYPDLAFVIATSNNDVDSSVKKNFKKTQVFLNVYSYSSQFSTTIEQNNVAGKSM